MPPIVTNLVPGETGVKYPRGIKKAIELAQRKTRLGSNHARFGVEGENPIGKPRVQNVRLIDRRKRGVTVRPAEAAGQVRFGAHSLEVFTHELAPLSRMSPPARERRKWWLSHAAGSVARRRLSP